MAKKLIYFALHTPREGEWSFTNYSDDSGMIVSLNIGMGRNGKTIPYTVRFAAGIRMITIPANKRDNDGNSIAEYIRNSPFCKDSELCEGKGMFFEIDPRRDAGVLIEEAVERNRAESYALDITGDKLSDLAAYVGEFANEEKIQTAAVYQWARRAPREFNNLAESPEVTQTAFFRKLFNKGIIEKSGFNHFAILDGTKVSIGPSEVKCIEKIVNDKQLRKALEARLDEKIKKPAQLKE